MNSTIGNGTTGKGTKVKGPKTLLHWTRLGVWAVALAGAFYLLLRFESVALPDDACSPLADVSAGAALIVDTWPEALDEGQKLLFRDPRDAGGEKLLLGRVATPPVDLPGDFAARVSAGGLWMLADGRDCPVEDSRLFGPVAPADVVGRIVLVWEP